MAALKIWWQTLRHLEYRGYIYVWANLCFVLFLIPVVTIPIGLAGLVKMSYMAHTSRHADLNTFWEGVRENFWQGLTLGVLTCFILVMNLSNLTVYNASLGLGVILLRSLWTGAIFLWLSVMLYVWPLYYEMESPSLIGALRNSLIMVLLNPRFTFIFWLGVALLVGLSLLIPPLALLLSFSVFSIAITRAVLNRLNASGYINSTNYRYSSS